MPIVRSLPCRYKAPLSVRICLPSNPPFPLATSPIDFSSIDHNFSSPSFPAVMHPLRSGESPRLQHSPLLWATCVSMQCCDDRSQILISESLLVLNKSPP